MKECEQLSGVVCKPNKYRQHGTIYILQFEMQDILLTEDVFNFACMTQLPW
jgi:hypothetical protein